MWKPADFSHLVALVFLLFLSDCDDAFDLQAMSRIFVGLCQCGAWGCFDEFNRLEERTLSAVSQQILTIQVGLREARSSITLLDKSVKLDQRVALYITMNPGYAGRSEVSSEPTRAVHCFTRLCCTVLRFHLHGRSSLLHFFVPTCVQLPDNLKQLFRGMAMTIADRLLIGQVMLYAQGFLTAEDLSGKVGLLFQLCEAQLSSQSHYDFGLRALKSVLRSAGNLKRAFISSKSQQKLKDEVKEKTDDEKNDEEREKIADEQKKTPSDEEMDLLVKAICATVAPKLVAADLSLFSTLVQAVFPGAHLHTANIPALRDAVSKLCAQPEYSLEDSALWVDKIMQLNEIQSIHHGIIMVGPASSGSQLQNPHTRRDSQPFFCMVGSHTHSDVVLLLCRIFLLEHPSSCAGDDGEQEDLYLRHRSESSDEGGTLRCARLDHAGVHGRCVHVHPEKDPRQRARRDAAHALDHIRWRSGAHPVTLVGIAEVLNACSSDLFFVVLFISAALCRCRCQLGGESQQCAR
jgi:hypothetical protein